MAHIEIKRDNNLRIIVVDHETDKKNESCSVESHLLFAILDKLEEIRCGGVDIKTGIEGLANISRST